MTQQKTTSKQSRNHCLGIIIASATILLSSCAIQQPSSSNGGITVSNDKVGQTHAIHKHWSQAIRTVDRKKAKLDAGDPGTLKDVSRVFQTTEPEDIQRISKNLEEISRMMTKSNCEIILFENNETPKALRSLLSENNQKIGAYTFARGKPRIYLNTDIIRQEMKDPRRIFIHEASHLAPGTEDHGYVNIYTLPMSYFLPGKKVTLTKKQLLNNADTYAYFICNS
jgi:Lysine-specific metallo-endopeptidase